MKPSTRIDVAAVILLVASATSAGIGYNLISENENLASIMLGAELLNAGAIGIALSIVCGVIGTAVAALRTPRVESHIVNNHPLPPAPATLPPDDYQWTPNGYQTRT